MRQTFDFNFELESLRRGVPLCTRNSKPRTHLAFRFRGAINGLKTIRLIYQRHYRHQVHRVYVCVCNMSVFRVVLS